MPTVLQCLTTCSNPYYTYISSTSVSKKPTAMNYAVVSRRIFNGGGQVLSVDSTTDNPRYNRVLPALPSPVPTEVYTEGDVRRVFAYITTFVEQAFILSPKVWHRWEAGPPGPSVTSAETIDTWWGVYLGQYERCAAIGELKRPGVIQKDEWYKPNPKSDTLQLGREIRMYAYQYGCPQAFFFDGYRLLVIRFQANSRDHIRGGNCMADCFFVEKESPDIPYWIDRLVAEGLERLRAECAGHVTLGGYERQFRYYDGMPFWTQGESTHWEHPGGYIRRFNNGEWWWYLDNVAQVLDTPKLE